MNQGIANHSDNNSPHGPAIVAPTLWTSGRNSRQLLTAEEQALIAVISTVVRFKKGERIYEEGDDANAVFSIITGVVKSYRTLPDRGQHIVGFLFADDVIGLAESGKYVNSAAAATAVTAYRIPTSRLEARLRNYPNLDFEVICKVCHELREAQRHAFLLSRHRAIAKVGLFLQMLEARENGTPELYLPMSRSDIGAYTAISPEAVSRSFRDLVRRGVISFRDRRHLRIIERTQLEAIISDTEARR